jgi:hypothetical protein
MKLIAVTYKNAQEVIQNGTYNMMYLMQLIKAIGIWVSFSLPVHTLPYQPTNGTKINLSGSLVH